MLTRSSGTARLPGVTFVVEPSAPAMVLPHMDIAAFVGLAACGPLDLPVAIEDILYFRELFGPNLPLAWDPAAGAMAYAQLAPSVELFFRNGGRRCWVVRVARNATAARFAVPGLLAAPDLAQARARARCEGSWADMLRVGAQLQARAFGVRAAEPVPGGPGRYAVELVAPPEEIRIGDLLRVRFGSAGPRLFLPADELTGGPAVWRAVGTGRWFEPIAAGSLPGEEVELAPLDAALGEERAAIFIRGGGSPVAEVLLFTLLVWRDRELVARIADLAFYASHPRFWARLPTDAELFGPPIRQSEPRALDAEAAAPRFPIAGPEEPAELYLPIRMRLQADPEATAPPDEADPQTALRRDGVEHHTADLFLDPDLAGLGADALLAGLFDKRYLREEPLRGLHTLLPIEEVTLVAVPDAALRPWRKEALPLPPALTAPTLVERAAPDAEGAYSLGWSAVAGADAYQLQAANDPGFASPVIAASSPALTFDAAGGLICPGRTFYRVRALRGGEPGPWSNTMVVLAPTPTFAGCDELPPLEGPQLTLTAGAAGGLDATWTVVDGAMAYELEEAREPTFTAPVRIASGPALGATLGPRPRGIYVYLRVRALRGDEAGAWSSTVIYLAGLREAWTLVSAEAYDDGDLLAVQRAVLRCCGARADVFAVLGMPRHYREAEALAHAQALRSYGAASGRLITGNGAVRVRALDPTEERLLSFGALYHPWLIAMAGSDAGIGRASVALPDGAMCGAIAARTIAAGAWQAPANTPLRGVVALSLEVSRASWAALIDARVNLVRRDPRGFMLLSADTLSSDAELRPINVRRLIILLRRLAVREGATYTFQANNEVFQRQVRRGFEQLLADLFRRGAFAGRTAGEAYQVVIDPGLNTRASIEQGRLIIELRVAPSRPMAFITIRLLQTGADDLSVQES